MRDYLCAILAQSVPCSETVRREIAPDPMTEAQTEEAPREIYNNPPGSRPLPFAFSKSLATSDREDREAAEARLEQIAEQDGKRPDD